MASAAGSTGWLRGSVKAVPSGDCLVIVGSTKADMPPEKTITPSSLMASRLARRGSFDEAFAWDSREFLRRLCIGKVFMGEVSPDLFGRETKHFTEIRDLNRDVRIVLEGVDSNLIGTVYYPDEEAAKDLSLELVENISAGKSLPTRS